MSCRETQAERLLKLFRKYPGRVITYKTIWSYIWGTPWLPNSTSNVRVLASQVRQICDGDLVNFKNHGYLYVPPDDDVHGIDLEPENAALHL